MLTVDKPSDPLRNVWYRVRALDEIERVRREKAGADLFEQLLWRIKLLGGSVDLAEPENREAFTDVLDAFVPDRHELVLDAASQCGATLERGGEVDFAGFLVSGGTVTAELERRLYLGRKWADHRRFRVVPRFRGNQIAPRSLIRSVELYTALGFEYVHLRAAHSGSWYWAQWGFHFENLYEMKTIQSYAQSIIDAFGGGLDATALTHPIQFLRLGEPESLTFDQLCDELPQRREGYEDTAYENGLAMHDPVPFGRILLMTGPAWDARLDLNGPDKLIFDDRAARLLGRGEKGGTDADS